MHYITFEEIAYASPYRISPELLRRFYDSGEQTDAVNIDIDTEFGPRTYIGNVKKIGLCTINSEVHLGDGVTVAEDVRVGEGTWLGRGVTIGAHTDIGYSNYFADGSSLPEGPAFKSHPYMRTTFNDVIIGPNVQLPAEVQLGYLAIIPTSKSVGQIGRFGYHKRMVTAYGSSYGPLFGVGCQYGIRENEFRARISDATGTEPESASDYHRNFSKIQRLGQAVQKAYDKETALIEELRGIWLDHDYKNYSSHDF